MTSMMFVLLGLSLVLMVFKMYQTELRIQELERNFLDLIKQDKDICNKLNQVSDKTDSNALEFTQIKNSLTNLKEKVVKYLELLEDK